MKVVSVNDNNNGGEFTSSWPSTTTSFDSWAASGGRLKTRVELACDPGEHDALMKLIGEEVTPLELAVRALPMEKRLELLRRACDEAVK